jgi:hypothetical protein
MTISIFKCWTCSDAQIGYPGSLWYLLQHRQFRERITLEVQLPEGIKIEDGGFGM